MNSSLEIEEAATSQSVMRSPVMGANWKLHKNAAETESFFESFRSLVTDFGYCDIVICPSFLDIPTAVSASEQTTIHIGAQVPIGRRRGLSAGKFPAR